MWVRDAARHHRLPTLEHLEDPRNFPYRYGHALWSYLAGRFGDGLVARSDLGGARTGPPPEVEWFGHERGAFSVAPGMPRGKLDMAASGSLVLD